MDIITWLEHLLKRRKIGYVNRAIPEPKTDDSTYGVTCTLKRNQVLNLSCNDLKKKKNSSSALYFMYEMLIIAFQKVFTVLCSMHLQDHIVPFVSSIFLRRLLCPGIHHNMSLRATLLDYNRHWSDSEFQSLTADGLKKEILSLIEHEVLVVLLFQILIILSTFCFVLFLFIYFGSNLSLLL